MAEDAVLAYVKLSLDIDHDDHDTILMGQIKAAEQAVYRFIGEPWRDVDSAAATVQEAIVAYTRELYNGNAEALVTDPARAHLFYRLLKPLAFTNPPEEEDE